MLRLINADNAEITEHKKLYRSAFPLNERFPWSMLVRRARKGRAELLTLEHDGKNAGFAYVMTSDRLAYLFFFAVQERCRGLGTGTETIKQLISRYDGKQFFLAIEPLDPTADNYQQRINRHRFYQTCGLKDVPCRVKEAKMVYSVMSTGQRVPVEDYCAMTDAFWGRRLRKLLGIALIYP